jgi:hypothetical protein
MRSGEPAPRLYRVLHVLVDPSASLCKLPGERRVCWLTDGDDPAWMTEVLDVVRGADAFEMLQEANPFNNPPPEGYEFVLASVNVVGGFLVTHRMLQKFRR